MFIDGKVIEFFKRHNLYNKEAFDYLSHNSTMIDYKDPEQRIFIGCFYVINKHNKKLMGIYLNIPYVYDDITMLINIHEITHGIIMYKKLGKKVIMGNDIEVIPMLYEKIFVDEQKNEKLNQYSKYLDNLISNEENYIIGLELRNKLINDYVDDLDIMEKRVKKLVKQYKRKNQ